MAVTLDTALGTGKAHTTLTVSVVTTAAVASGAMIDFTVAGFIGANTYSVTATGGLTWATSHHLVSGSLHIYKFRAFAPSGLASSTTLTATATGSNADHMAMAVSFLGVDNASPVSAFNASTASTAAWSSGNVAGSSGDMLTGAAFEDGSGTATSSPTAPGVEYADFNDATQTEAMTGVYKLSVAGTDVIAGTWSGAVSHVAIGVAYKAAAGAADASLIPMPFRTTSSLYRR